MKVAITGHRPPRIKGKEKEIEFWIEEQLKNLKACYKDVILITGMALGVDQMAALIAIKNGIRVHCYLPFRKKGKVSSTYDYILDNAEEILYLNEKYIGKSVYITRDRKMVEDCDILMVVYDGKDTGGTAYTYNYGKTLNKNMFIYPWNARRSVNAT